MGRYAQFTCSGDASTETVEREYKFWFAIQDSVIPWASTEHNYYVNEYDEDYEGLPECVMTWWKEHQEATIDREDVERKVPEDVLPYIDDICILNHDACDSNENLEQYWDETRKLAESLGLPQYMRKEGEDIFDALDRYEADVLYKAEGEDRFKKVTVNRQLADLHLMTTVCCCLEAWESYNCEYEE